MKLDKAQKVATRIKKIIEIHTQMEVERADAFEDSFGNWMVFVEVALDTRWTPWKLKEVVCHAMEYNLATLKPKNIVAEMLPEIAGADQRYRSAKLQILLNPKIARESGTGLLQKRLNTEARKDEDQMKLIDVVRLTEEDEKIMLVIKGVETSETKSLTPQLLTKYSEQTVEHITVGVDALVITINRAIEIAPSINLPNGYMSCSCT